MGLALAGGLVVKEFKEKVCSGEGTREASYTERRTYGIHWNKSERLPLGPASDQDHRGTLCLAVGF